ncbi:MAG: type II toxin-antitoxin system prevent-host-death family antitoxin [Deltaproteobacteria bacterium]|nr:type II toxin-antitoxin system prevent-host-death family antitoxin [Deltaproteobacteria bacterium]
MKIAEFKTHLSKYLRRVRAGEEVIVTDRDHPVARVSPIEPLSERLIIRPARGSPKDLDRLTIPPAHPGTDSLKALLADREDDLDAYIEQYANRRKK